MCLLVGHMMETSVKQYLNQDKVSNNGVVE